MDTTTITFFEISVFNGETTYDSILGFSMAKGKASGLVCLLTVDCTFVGATNRFHRNRFTFKVQVHIAHAHI